MTLSLIQRMAADDNIDAAYHWLCRRRRRYHHNDDVWWLRHDWPRHKARLQQQWRDGAYRLGPLQIRRCEDGDHLWWDAADALTLRALSQTLGAAWRPRASPHCTHLAGHGGVVGALRRVRAALSEYEYVFRTDVRGYYANIDHTLLLPMLADAFPDPLVLRLLYDYVSCTLCDGGLFHSMRRGICRGGSLSPLIGALYLDSLDQAMTQRDVFYVRYMDDWVVLCRSHGQLRRAVARVNSILNGLTLRQHPDKTFIGRISRGFDFLGWQFHPDGCRPTASSLHRRDQRIARLYEQGASDGRVGAYLRRWEMGKRTTTPRTL
ncbi:reverse transcriptase/maturase family protein [Chromobacterium haemolyticum]|uniref:reverse transcriptase/maturase family protein n=1 Tax=Chromobacterium haemolyticum TaxID=394935 RepID=UPI0015948956|nr:reverse transcriptase/maturase family protein [Chromobacterium haemolyticum]